MGWNRTRSPNVEGQAAATRGTASSVNPSAALTKSNPDENQARWHVSNVGRDGRPGWGEVLLDLARALGAHPAA